MRVQSTPILVRHGADGMGADAPVRLRKSGLAWVRVLLVLCGLGSLGYYGYTVADQQVYQSYENWAFDHSVSGGGPVTFVDYLRQKTWLGLLFGKGTAAPYAPVQHRAESRSYQQIAPGSVLGRVEIPRLGLQAMVREGVTTGVLAEAVGHVPATALAGQPGNFAIAAHRDTLFRALKDITDGDEVRFESPAGTYTYQVFSTRIVKPTEVSVLRPDGALPEAKLQSAAFQPGAGKLITLITCYPFYYVGSAPERFIVQGRLVGQSGPRAETPPPLKAAAAVAGPRERAHVNRERAHINNDQKPRPSRGFSHVKRRAPPAVHTPDSHHKKHHFWQRLIHRS